jgi:hypothetical protein
MALGVRDQANRRILRLDKPNVLTS